MMDRREALGILADIVDSFPSNEDLDALEADAGPGHRHYLAQRFSDAFIRSAREAMDTLRKELNI
jgi:hypothetical protein